MANTHRPCRRPSCRRWRPTARCGCGSSGRKACIPTARLSRATEPVSGTGPRASDLRVVRKRCTIGTTLTRCTPASNPWRSPAAQVDARGYDTTASRPEGQAYRVANWPPPGRSTRRHPGSGGTRGRGRVPGERTAALDRARLPQPHRPTRATYDEAHMSYLATIRLLLLLATLGAVMLILAGVVLTLLDRIKTDLRGVRCELLRARLAGRAPEIIVSQTSSWRHGERRARKKARASAAQRSLPSWPGGRRTAIPSTPSKSTGTGPIPSTPSKSHRMRRPLRREYSEASSTPPLPSRDRK